MDQELPRHEKIKFRRDEITDLSSLPSACKVPPLGRAAIGRWTRVLARIAVGAGALVLLLAVSLYLLGVTGIGSERIRSAAERALERMAGVDVAVAMGPARITLDGSSFLALRVDDIHLRTGDGRPMVDAGMMRFGVRLIPLLWGEVRLSSAKISDARIVAAALPSTGGDWAAALRDGQGLIDPGKVPDAVFASVHDALDAVQSDSMRRIDLDNVELVLSDGGLVHAVRVEDATIRQSGAGRMEFSSDVGLDGRELGIVASAVRDVAARRITDLDVTIELDGPPASAGHQDGSVLGAGSIRLSGVEGGDGTDSRLNATASFADSVLDFGTHGQLPGDVELNATLAAGSGKIAVDRLLLKTGRSTFDFEGSIGPKPATGALGEEPAYRYDLVSDGSTLAPLDSPEPALNFIARIAGTYQLSARRLVADTIALKSGAEGGVTGNASVEFAHGKAPGILVALGVRDMPVSHVKQLWPWFSAGNARRWVLENLFGGRVVDASLQFNVVPDRLGNGVPLSGDEVFGRFQLEGSRFDTAGRIPPIRDAIGAVEFHGNDVDISLASGTVYMASGRTVAASNGTLKMTKANVPPVIGALDIDVAGEAPAIAELASYEPINAMRHVGIVPDELSGTVTGNIKADIPLQAGVDSDTLDWLVTLDYHNLALAKPFDGQKVTDADGSITVDPKKAVISADARLNGVPATLELVEPLKDGGPPRSRDISLVLDDKTRETLMPGLSTLLSGPVKVTLARTGENGRQDVSADLGGARLSIPWAGWSKGAGIPAKVNFTMQNSGSTATLSDFDLDGRTFSIQGTVTLSGGSLSSARFSKVQLNRGDDVSVSIRRSGGGYAVTVKGNSLDARSLIKQFTSDVDTATKDAGSDSISVSADVASLTGFNDERLSNLNLEYSTSGSAVNGLKVSATAGSGGTVTVSNTTSGGRRALNMRSADAGAVLRFLDIYEHMQGGGIALNLSGSAGSALSGSVDARDFQIVDEPKLASIVSNPPAGDSRSLDQALKGKIDASRVRFERGYAEIEKGEGYVKLAKGVLRGPVIGTTFQGTLYDRNNNMDMTGTFMPAYGVNRIFGEIPLFGELLGNGRDRGLIGVTYRLKGNANKPDLQVNPLSIIAPGIFRSIFEYR